MKMVKFLTLFLLSATVVAANASEIYSTAFEEQDGFQLGPLDSASSKWATDGPYPFVIVDGTHQGRNSQILESTSANNDEASRVWLSDVDFGGADKVVVELDIMALPSGGKGYQANIQLGEFSGKPKTTMHGTAAQVSLRGSGRIVAFDGQAETEIAKYAMGEWIKLRIETDHSTQKYSVSVNGETVGEDLNFRDPTVFRSRGLGFTHYSGMEGTQPFAMALDNISITAQ